MADNNNDNGSFGWAVLGFLFPLIGLILWAVWRGSRPGDAHKSIVGAIVGFVVSILFGVLYGVLMGSAGVA